MSDKYMAFMTLSRYRIKIYEIRPVVDLTNGEIELMNELDPDI